MKNYKTGLIIFLFLSTIISLFPPFEWGNEKFKTEKDRIINRNFLERLPIKNYDLLFASKKKYFLIGGNNYEQKIYNEEKIDVNTFSIITKKISDSVVSFYLNRIVKRMKFLYDWADYEKDSYNEIKNKTGNADTIQYYKTDKLVKPHWYLLQRELNLKAFILQYLLAVFIAFFVQVVIAPSKKKKVNEKSNA